MLYPTFEFVNGGWFTQSNFIYSHGNGSPVSDINSQGQAVGMSQYLVGQVDIYAAFTGPNLHNQGEGFVADNLNNYIATIPGVSLTSAVNIDDLGRIVAFGSNGDAYLLTPDALGVPATVPEPSTALMMGLAGSLFGVRSVRRQWVRRAAGSLVA